jgi:hypothetical protein
MARTCLFLAMTVAFLATGCRTEERALKLVDVTASLRAVGLRHLEVLTSRKGYEEAKTRGLILSAGAAPDGPDYITIRGVRALIVVRFGKISAAAHAVPTARIEGPNPDGLRVRATRACNVVVLDYRPGDRRLRALAARVLAQIRRRCA